MGRKKAFMLIAIFLIVSSLSIVNIVYAQSIPKPSVPEFSLRYVDNSYNVPETHSIDPYTGQNVTTPSYHVSNRTIEITIKNQPFTPSNNSTFSYSFFYNVRAKGHYFQNWTELYNPESGFPTQSNSDYTIISNPVGDLPSNATVDFQVKAMIGGIGTTMVGSMTQWIFSGQESSWSSTQTITVPVSSSSPSPSPTVPELSWLAIVPLMVSILSIALVLRHRKTI